VTAIHILDEGVDLPKCDSVFITRMGEWTSDIRTVQRICRANRIDSQNPNKIASCFLWTDDLNKTVNALKLFRENDPEFHRKIHMINSDYDRNESVEVVAQEKAINFDFQNYINIECLSQKEMWQYKYKLLFEFADKFQRAPKDLEHYNGWPINGWFSTQKHKILVIP